MLHLPIIFAAKYLHLIVILIAAGLLLVCDSSIRRKILKLGVLALPASYITAKILSRFFYNARPFVVEHTQPLINHTANNGFPSDHTLLTMTIAAVFFAYNRKVGSLLMVLGLAVGIGRILARIHYPIDILGSITIAFAVTYTCKLILDTRKPLNLLLDKLLKAIKI